MCTHLFKVEPKYVLTKEHEEDVLNQIITIANEEESMHITNYERIITGQNIIYKLISKKTNCSYQLKIIARKGYPCIETLNACYEYLEMININKPKIIYYDTKDYIVPYGYIIQSWIEGEVYSHKDKDDTEWIVDFASHLRDVHKIKLNGFGYLGKGPVYPTLKEYFYNMDQIVDHSFGEIFKDYYSIWDLQKYELISDGFLETTFANVKYLANQIKIDPEPILLHGDMLPNNLIQTENGTALIDWDESKSGWWVYEIARTLFYIDNKKEHLKSFLKAYNDTQTPLLDIYNGIRLEHIRQLLRKLFMSAFTFNTTNLAEIRLRIRYIELKINELLDSPLLDEI
ncbi:aminoglycoside phosphotransferase family protein [Haloplasma contractile]|uniref:Aminoglycoside phosphotransferase Protein kinase related diverged n=1 Tax=Haloplasma contractile SSD-17B TaxID=1033810 RepID=F7Q2H4_9MOLU|nr:aminoglycoside phosphotransferase family protein [Haloplasma contractile]ERJ11953.1 putative aminoglycoside phosphotransferase Protein kinase related diverged [Haloplasma contractile SSD-17B]